MDVVVGSLAPRIRTHVQLRRGNLLDRREDLRSWRNVRGRRFRQHDVVHPKRERNLLHVLRVLRHRQGFLGFRAIVVRRSVWIHRVQRHPCREGRFGERDGATDTWEANVRNDGVYNVTKIEERINTPGALYTTVQAAIDEATAPIPMQTRKTAELKTLPGMSPSSSSTNKLAF